jgi:hypothetical protein
MSVNVDGFTSTSPNNKKAGALVPGHSPQKRSSFKEGLYNEKQNLGIGSLFEYGRKDNNSSITQFLIYYLMTTHDVEICTGF